MVHTEKTHVVFKILGIILLILGVIGIFLPLVPAFLLIPAGLTMMGEKRVHTWWLKRKQ